MDLGFEMLELDCQLTMDKKVVVAHDDHLGRVSGIDTLISETKYEVSDKRGFRNMDPDPFWVC